MQEGQELTGALLGIGLTGFLAEMYRIAVGTASGEDMSWERYSFIGYPLSQLVDGGDLDQLELAVEQLSAENGNLAASLAGVVAQMNLTDAEQNV